MKRLWIVALAVFALDQILKYFVLHWLNLDVRRAIDVWPPYLNLRMAWNDGINFGLGEGVSRWVWVSIAVVIVALVLRWVRRETGVWTVMVSAGLLVGGAAGNVIDRLVYGAVADFLNTSCCGFRNPFAFNVADIAIFLGAVGLVIFAGRDGRA